MKKDITPRDVRKALDAQYGAGVIEFHRSPAGYYYFMSEQHDIPSLYYYNLRGVALTDIMQHVAEHAGA